MQFGQLERSFLEDDLWLLYSCTPPSDGNEWPEEAAKEPEQPDAALRSAQRYLHAVLQRFKRRSQALAVVKPNS